MAEETVTAKEMVEETAVEEVVEEMAEETM